MVYLLTARRLHFLEYHMYRLLGCLEGALGALGPQKGARGALRMDPWNDRLGGPELPNYLGPPKGPS